MGLVDGTVDYGESFVDEERPLELPAFILSPKPEPSPHQFGDGHLCLMYLSEAEQRDQNGELAPTRKLFATPRHPYTQALLSAIPRLNQSSSDYIRLKGEVPTPVHLPSGCVFHGRCAQANERCRTELPRAVEYEDTTVACHAVEEGRI